MTLVTLASGFIPVALLFLGAAWVGGGRTLVAGSARLAMLEAALLSLIAGLWFASLGGGGWPLLFLLFGLLVGVVEWAREAPAGGTSRMLRLALTVARYAAAGALLAWRLG